MIKPFFAAAFALPSALPLALAIAFPLASTSAIGADLPPPPPVFTWTGAYIGFNAGYTFRNSANISAATTNVLDAGARAGVFGAASAVGATGVVSSGLDGFFSGGQIGYNWQFAERYVIGLEADIQGAGVRGGGNFVTTTPSYVDPASSANSRVTVHRDLEYLGTARARAGYALAPNFLLYATGGLAYGGVDLSAKVRQTLSPSALFSPTGKGDLFENRVGWTIGGGAELAFTPNLSAKFEALYYDLGRATISGFPSQVYTNVLNGAVEVADTSTVSTRYNGVILRAGINYRFDGSAPTGSGSAATPLFAVPTFVAAPPPAFGDWKVSITPYAWAADTNGTMTARGDTVDVNASFIDVLTRSSSIPLPFMGHLEARNGPLSLYGDITWMRLRFAGSATRQFNPVADLGVGVNATAFVKETLTIVEAGAFYELARWSVSGGAPAAFTAIDAFAAARYWNVNIAITGTTSSSVSSNIADLQEIGSTPINNSLGMHWVDPVIGLRLRQTLTADDEFILRGDIGGFGVGSKFSWQVFGGYSHQFSFGPLNVAGVIGYRALGVDYSTGSGDFRRGVDMVMHGPIIGLTLPF